MNWCVRSSTDYSALAEVKDGVPISELLDVNRRRRRLTKGTPATYVGMSALPEFFPAISSWAMKEVGSGQKFQNGDVLMARITPCLENGKTAVVDMLHPDEVGWGSTEYVVLSPQGEITTPWIYSFVRHETVRQWAIQRMTGSSGRRRLNAGDSTITVSIRPRQPCLLNLMLLHNHYLNESHSSATKPIGLQRCVMSYCRSYCPAGSKCQRRTKLSRRL